MTRSRRRREVRSAAFGWMLAATALALCLLGPSCRGSSSERQPAAGTAAAALSPATIAASADGLLRPDEQAAYVVNPDGSGLRELFRDDSYDYIDIAPSPDGKTLAVAARSFADTPRSALFLVDTADASRRSMDNIDGSISLPQHAWSPDGSRLVVQEFIPAPDGPGSQYRVVTSRTGAISDPVATPGELLGWAADGTQFFFYTPYVSSGQSRIASVAVADLSVRTIVETPSITNAALSPDGSEVAYSSQTAALPDTPTWQVSVVATTDGAATPRPVTSLSTTGFGVYGLDWSPDGSEIAYGWAPAGGDPGQGVYLARAAGGAEARQVTTTQNYDVLPRWSADGRWLLISRLVCVACDGSSVQTVVAAADGSSITALTPATDGSSYAAWAPVGASFAYGADELSVRQATDPQHGSVIARLPASSYSPLLWAGGRVFFTRSATGADVLFGMSVGGTSAKVLAIGQQMAVSDDRQIAAIDGGGIAITGTDGSTLRIDADFLRQDLAVGAPALTWAPDGQHLALAVLGGQVDILDVFELHANGTWGAHATTAHPTTDVRWSPDSTMLAYVAADGAYVVPASEGGAAEQIAAKGATALDWSPDGTTIAVASNEVVRLVRLDGAGTAVATRLTRAQANVTEVHWSPDGKRIALVTPNAIEIVIADAPTLSIAADLPGGVAWSPDSTRLAYGHNDCARQSCRQRLTVVNADGTKPRDIVDALGRVLKDMRWADDDSIVFISIRGGI